MYKINWSEETTLLQLHNCSSLGYTTCKYKKANSLPQAHLTPNQIRRKSTGTKREWSVLKKLYSPSITIIPTPMSINDCININSSVSKQSYASVLFPSHFVTYRLWFYWENYLNLSALLKFIFLERLVEICQNNEAHQMLAK